MPLKLTIMLLTLMISPTNFANEFSENAKLFLVGGGLKTCSSMSKSQCESVNFIADDDKREALYQLNYENIDTLFKHWPKNKLPKQRADLQRLLKKMTRANKKVVNKLQLRELWQSQDGSSIINKLADREYYLMLDALEVLQVNSKERRASERVLLEKNKNKFSKEIFETFTHYAALKTKREDKIPRILVVTASARDPYEAVDFYVEVFKATGADVSWLPIDAALNSLWQEEGHSSKSCKLIENYQDKIMHTIKRKFIYPDRFLYQQAVCQQPDMLLQLIKEADGLFINGGDQSLTAQAFINSDGNESAALQLIKQQIANNELVVGGTSAGAAVLSGGVYAGNKTPMITNGRSEVAIFRGAKADVLPSAGCQKAEKCVGDLLNDDLTYNSTGGLGLFPWGIIDTHFSERGRQGRLIRLVQDTDSYFAFGVDEASALVVSWQDVNKPSMKIIGQSGVFIAEKKNTQNYTSLLTHYLTRDDEVSLSEGKLDFRFAPWKTTKSDNIKVSEIDSVFDGDNYVQALNRFCRSTQSEITLNATWSGKESKFTISKTEEWQSASGTINKYKQARQYCSYYNGRFDYH